MKLSGTVVLGMLVVGAAVFLSGKVDTLRHDTQIGVYDTGPSQGTTQVYAARGQNEVILAELRQIRQLLEQQQRTQPPAPAAPPEPQRVTLPGSSDYVLGNPDAPLTLVEFVDYQCPFCSRFHEQTFERLKTTFIDTGKVRFVSRDLPLPFHAQATKAAQAARCAAEQGQFWPMRTALMSNLEKLGPDDFLAHAEALSLDMGPFRECVAGDKHLAGIQQDITDANGVGISGTPSFVLGTKAEGGITGLVIVGAHPYATFEARIQEMLSE